MRQKIDQTMIDRLVSNAQEGNISRRSFINYSVTAGMTATAATGLWSTSAKAAPKRGGKLRVAQHDGNTTDQLDPGNYLSHFEISMSHTFRSYLTLINTDGTLGGDIASEWSATPDATEWTFKVDPNATFHDGNKVTGKDVLASMNHHRGEDSGSAAKALLASVEEITDNGDNTVTFRLSEPNADLPWIMPDYHLAICPANEDGSLNWQSGMGSGPYKLVELNAGVGGQFVRFDDWHGEGAYFDEVEIIVINDPNARQTALVTGDVDACSLIENKTMGLMSRNADIEIDNVPSAQTVTLPMLTDVAPLDNADVRLALKYAINREELVEKVAFGAATIGNDFHHSPAMPYWPDDIPQRAYDPDKAKFHLKKAGLDSLDISMSAAESILSGAVDLAVLCSEHAKEAGINITAVREPNDGFWSDVWLVKPWCVVVWGARPTPDVIYTLAYKDDASWNETRWKNPAFNTILAQAKAELDDVKRAEMYRDMALIMRDDGGSVIPYFPNFVYGRRTNLRHSGQVAASWQMDGYRFASRWWFEG